MSKDHDDNDVDAKLVGFWCGHRLAFDGHQPLPPNPYRLRSPARTQWSAGYIVGRRLGIAQREEADKVAASLTTATPEA